MRLRPAFPGGVILPLPPPPPLPKRASDAPPWQVPFAPLLQLPLRQGAGTPAVAVVREGEEVVRGQLLAQADGEHSTPLHAPATGIVQAIVEQADPASITASSTADGTVQVIQLAPLPGDTQEQAGGAGIDPASASAADVLAAIAASGLVGQGGEARPTHVRVRAAADRGAGWLVLNGIEGEPGFRRVRAMLRNQAADLLFGLRCLLKASGATRAVLAVERRDEDLARALLKAAPAGLELLLRVLPPRYPQGAEALLLRVLATPGEDGGPAIAPGALCLNVVTVAELGRLLAGGLGMTDQVISLAGGALHEPGSYRVPLGTPLRYALAQAGLAPGVACVLQGGPMRGEALASLDGPVSKGATGFVALDPAEAGTLAQPMPCIRCGDCLAACPLQLNPAQLGLLARKGEVEVMHEQYHLDRCFECGCCAYVCPSRIPLVEQFRAAKAQWRRRQRDPVGEDAA